MPRNIDQVMGWIVVTFLERFASVFFSFLKPPYPDRLRKTEATTRLASKWATKKAAHTNCFTKYGQYLFFLSPTWLSRGDSGRPSLRLDRSSSMLSSEQGHAGQVLRTNHSPTPPVGIAKRPGLEVYASAGVRIVSAAREVARGHCYCFQQIL